MLSPQRIAILFYFYLRSSSHNTFSYYPLRHDFKERLLYPNDSYITISFLMSLHDHVTSWSFYFPNDSYTTISFLLSSHFGWSTAVLLWGRGGVTIAVKSVAIAMNRDRGGSGDYDRTAIVPVFSLASSIEEMHASYNPFSAS
jgi:hypothetical protein